MTVRIVVTGPECTGKTTLAAALADSIGAKWVPEAARLYAERAARRGRTLSAGDVEPIARAQMRAEDAALRTGRGDSAMGYRGDGAGARATTRPPARLVLDTDLVSTAVYAQHYYGLDVPWISAAALERRGNLYVLAAPDIPWVADGIRDRPAAREAMFAQFQRALQRIGANVVEVRGLGDARFQAAIKEVRSLLEGERK
ncbi:MAG: ATP-binding protein [Gemmatimonadaceae bacterium]|nr:ATP-binding protein [Gemmatimonadaceae bacterium]